MPYAWSSEPLNLLSPLLVTAVRDALNDGIVCGVHAFYCGGRGPEPCAFSDMDSYLRAVEQSRPGDRFTLWSVEALARRGALLTRKQASPITESELKKIEDWLNADQMREFISVGHKVGAPPEVEWGDYDSFDKIQRLAQTYAPAGEFALLSLTDLLERNQHPLLLLHAKRPNVRGEIPLGGAY